MPSHCCNNVYIFFFMTVLTSEPEQQQQQHPSEDGVTKTNLVQAVAEKKQLLLKQDPSPAISITTTSAVATTGPSGVITQCMSSGHANDFKIL